MSHSLGAGDAWADVAVWSGEAFREDTSFGKCLMRYLEGWADANPLKILAATARGYRFEDPLVGTFTQRSLPRYFGFLQERFAFRGRMEWGDVAFQLRGPMAGLPRHEGLQFWREAPGLGLTGVTRIVLSEQGVVAESVAYDLNMACAVLRDLPSSCRNVTDEEW
jgi:hypothetical protein